MAAGLRYKEHPNRLRTIYDIHFRYQSLTPRKRWKILRTPCTVYPTRTPILKVSFTGR